MTDGQIAWVAVVAIVVVVFLTLTTGQRHGGTEVHTCDGINRDYQRSCHEITSGWSDLMKQGRK